MKDYSILLSIRFTLRARDLEQASERADLVSEALHITPPKRERTWWPDETFTDVAEVEEQ